MIVFFLVLKITKLVEIQGIKFIGEDIDYESLSDVTIELLYAFVFGKPVATVELEKVEPCRELVVKENMQRSQVGSIDQNKLLPVQFVSSIKMGQFTKIHLSLSDDSTFLKVELFANSNSTDIRKVTYFISREILLASGFFTQQAFNRSVDLFGRHIIKNVNFKQINTNQFLTNGHKLSFLSILFTVRSECSKHWRFECSKHWLIATFARNARKKFTTERCFQF